MSHRSAYALTLLFAISATPVVAVTPVTPVGVESCDAFLEAYAQCAASPGVPEAARPGINTMRESFRDSVLRNEVARPTLAYQCAQAHNAVRKSLIDAFKCDFPPAPPASQSLLQSPPPSPGAARVAARSASAQTPDAQALAKANAYAEAQNYLVRSHPLEQQLADYRRDNERVLKLGTKLGANAWYHFGIVDFDGVIDELERAMQDFR